MDIQVFLLLIIHWEKVLPKTAQHCFSVERLLRMERTARSFGSNHIPHQHWSGERSLPPLEMPTLQCMAKTPCGWCLKWECAFLWHVTVSFKHFVIYPVIGATCRYSKYLMDGKISLLLTSEQPLLRSVWRTWCRREAGAQTPQLHTRAKDVNAGATAESFSCPSSALTFSFLFCLSTSLAKEMEQEGSSGFHKPAAHLCEINRGPFLWVTDVSHSMLSIHSQTSGSRTRYQEWAGADIGRTNWFRLPTLRQHSRTRWPGKAFSDLIHPP